jgi:signal transduction histidine kinase
VQKIESDLLFIFTASFFFLILILFVVLILVVRYRKKRRENEEMQTLFSEQLLSSKLEIQEQTLLYMSRELHDNIGQIASLVKINLNTISLADTDKASKKIENTKELMGQLIIDLKLLSTSLNTDKIAKIGVIKAIEVEVEKMNKIGLFLVSLHLDKNLPIIDSEREIIIFRMVQEVLNNTMKHAEASQIDIYLNYDNKNLTIKITDNGKGFNVKQKMTNADDLGNGLTNLENRARVINGNYKIESTEGEGTINTISIPI